MEELLERFCEYQKYGKQLQGEVLICEREPDWDIANMCVLYFLYCKYFVV